MQFDFGNLESPLSGTVFINGNLEPWRDALHSSHKGDSRPSYAVEGMMWVNDTTNPWILNMFDGSDDISIGTFDTTTNVFTPSGVSQAAEDISFDNTDSGLTATNVQDAIDEAVSDFSDFESRADGFATAAQGALADTALQPSDLPSIPIVTDWVAYTPTFTGFGTPTAVSFISRRVGDTLQLRGTFNSGAPTSSEARITLGYNGVNAGIVSDNTGKIPSGVSLSGSAARSTTSANQFCVLIEPNTGYVTFGLQGATTGGLSKQPGSQVITNTVSMSIYAEIPIQGW